MSVRPVFRNRVIGLQQVRARDLIPHPGNWRTHSDAQRATLQGLLGEVGFVDAVIARKLPRGKLQIIDGHLRAETAGDETVPVLVVDLSEDEALIVLATLDPLAAMAGADAQKLDELLGSISTESDAVQKLLDDIQRAAGPFGPAAGKCQPDDVPESPKSPSTRIGDLYILGDHRLLCGDSTKPDAVSRLLDGAIPSIMVTDPPYGVKYDPSWRTKAGLGSTERTGIVLNDDQACWTDAWRLFPGNVAYVWHGGLHSATVQQSLHDAGFLVRAQLVWVKPRLVISRCHYHWQHESAFVAEKPDESDQDAEGQAVEDRTCEEAWYSVRKGATADWRGGRKQTTVWEIGFQGEVKTEHGTQKPVECMARPIRNHGGAGDAVYEPFCGSGSTLIAAEQCGRRCFAMELNPVYCDVIVKRWEQFTGNKAERMRCPESHLRAAVTKTSNLSSQRSTPSKNSTAKRKRSKRRSKAGCQA